MVRVLKHVRQTIFELNSLEPDDIEFQETTDPRQTTMNSDSVTLGVMPDYTYSGDGFRIEEIRDGGPADQYGLMDGDVIIQMGTERIDDIYDYMDALGNITSGDRVSIVVLREGEEIEIEITF
jgi:S1-C subfamily serine protease